MSEHTKGQVKYRGCETLAVVETVGGREAEPIAHCGGANALGNARRLAALWENAEDMDTKEIEQGMLMVNVRDKINAQARELTAARALLREILDADEAALKELKEIGFGPDLRDMGASLLTDRIRNHLDACNTMGDGNG